MLDEQAKQRDLMVESLSSRDDQEEERSQTEAEESLASDPEERPVTGGGRTFQQLLAEKLQEEGGPGQAEISGTEMTPVRARPFLKKGSGLSKYKMGQETPGKRTPSPRKTPSEGRKLSSALVTGPSSTGRSGRKQVSIQSPPKSLKLNPRYNLSDSVENSFCDKLSLMATRQDKDRAELEVFRQLETAANEASFCSNSSRIQNLVSEAVLPSPSRQRSVSFVSSTPAPPHSQSQAAPLPASAGPEPALDMTEEGEEATLGQSIMLDIKKFLLERLSSEEKAPAPLAPDNDSDWTDESEDTLEDTLEDTEETAEVSIGTNWKENVPPPVKTAARKPQELLTFSPPEKLPANPPSQLIWDIFGREHEARKKEAQQQQQKMRTKSASGLVKSQAATQRRKSAPLSVKFDPNTNTRARSGPEEEAETEENVSYNSTLLRMRVVGKII